METIYTALGVFDDWLGSVGLSDWGRVAVFGCASGALGFLVYWLVSSQSSIADTRELMRQQRAELMAAVDDMATYRRLAILHLRTSLRLLKLQAIPILFSVIPILVVAVWADYRYGYVFKAGAIEIALPGDVQASQIVSVPGTVIDRGSMAVIVVPQPVSNRDLSISIRGDLAFQGNIFNPAVDIVHLHSWLSWFLPASVLSEASAGGRRSDFTYLSTNAVPRMLFEGASGWRSLIAGWDGVFFLSLLLAWFGLKFAHQVR